MIFKIIILISALVVILNIPLSGQVRYYKGNTHCHTTNSDGWATPDSTAKYYKSLGFDFLVMTDHNYYTNGEAINIPGFLLINGEEITMSGTHINGYRLSRLINPSGYTVQRAIDSVNAQNGIAVLNHPRIAETWYTYSMVMALNNITHFEVLNYLSEVTGLWDSLLTQGNRTFYGMAADDSHYAFMCGAAWIMVKAGALQRDSILKSIKNGNFYATNGILLDSLNQTQTSIYIKFSSNCRNIKFIGKNGTVYKEVVGNASSYNITGNEKYIRIYASGLLNLTHAWTQPFYINSVGIVSEETPVRFVLHQNYPNPFNPVTQIQFSVLKTVNVKLTVYDILGNEVQTLVNEAFKPGEYRITFDGSNLSSGTYYYKLTAGNFSETKKMLLIK